MTAAELLEHLRTLRLQPPASPAARGEAAQALFLMSRRFEQSCGPVAPCDACRLADDLLDGRDPELEMVLRLEDLLRPTRHTTARAVIHHEGCALYAHLESDGVVTIWRLYAANRPMTEFNAVATDRGRWSPTGHIVEAGGSAFLGREAYEALEAALRRAMDADGIEQQAVAAYGRGSISLCAAAGMVLKARAMREEVGGLGSGDARQAAPPPEGPSAGANTCRSTGCDVGGQVPTATLATTAGKTAESGPVPLAAGGSPALSDPCAACGRAEAEFCDLCAACEQRQYAMGGTWDNETLARLRAEIAGAS